MKSQKKWLIGIIVMLILMNVTILTFFWLGRRPPNPNKITNHFINELNLDKAQAETFKNLFEKHLSKSENILDSTALCKEQMFKMVVQPNRDTEALKEIVQKIGQLEARREENLIEHYIGLENACNSEEQKEELRKIFAKSIPKPKGRPRRK